MIPSSHASSGCQRRRSDHDDGLGRLTPVLQQSNDPTLRIRRSPDTVGTRRGQGPAVAGITGLLGCDVPARKDLQAGGVEVVTQRRVFGELIEGACLVQPEAADPGASECSQVPANPRPAPRSRARARM